MQAIQCKKLKISFLLSLFCSRQCDNEGKLFHRIEESNKRQTSKDFQHIRTCCRVDNFILLPTSKQKLIQSYCRANLQRISENFSKFPWESCMAHAAVVDVLWTIKTIKDNFNISTEYYYISSLPSRVKHDMMLNVRKITSHNSTNISNISCTFHIISLFLHFHRLTILNWYSKIKIFHWKFQSDIIFWCLVSPRDESKFLPKL